MANILIIDDEESIRFAFEDFLLKEGHKVFTAKNYGEALAILSELDLDLIFSDIVLGGKTGVDILRDVKAKGLNCPVVMITGYPNVETASEAVRLGAFDYLAKPVRKDGLLHATGLALQHKALMDEKEKYRHDLEAVFRSVKDAIITVDKDLLILTMNEAAEGICGLGADAIGKAFDSLEYLCKGRCRQAVKETIESRQFVEIRRLECHHRDNDRQVVNLSLFPLIDRHGLFSGGVMVIRDETRLVNLEEDLKERREFYNIIGKSEAMQKVYTLIDALADVETTVLVTGESGTGKELVAEALHYSGERSQRPYVKVNCAALSENLLESELFGHVRGAFTGAVKDKIGRFEKAAEGTIFLDEIGSISPKMQASLLRVLQDRAFERVGESTLTKVDVRVIAATNKNLLEKVRNGEFREDLYYRLKVVEVHMPPLRERQEDIPLLVDHFLKKFVKKFNRKISAVSEDVMALVMDYPWPGNVRELEHALEHCFVLCRQETITLSHLPSEFQDFKDSVEREASASLEGEGASDCEALLQALRKTGGNKAKAARLLGIAERTVFRKIKQYGITVDEIQVQSNKIQVDISR